LGLACGLRRNNLIGANFLPAASFVSAAFALTSASGDGWCAAFNICYNTIEDLDKAVIAQNTSSNAIPLLQGSGRTEIANEFQPLTISFAV
jgi:hypothetical protein